MKRLKGLILALVVIISAFGLVACSTAPETEGTSAEANNQEVNEVVEYEPVTIVHELGETIIEDKPERVIIFDYGILDAMDKIGEDIVGLPKATLPTYLDKFASDEYEDVGSLKEPNFEKIYELAPDLIIISTRQATLYDDFTKIAPTVYLPLDGADYLNSFKHNMDVIGEIFHKEDMISEEVSKIEAAIADLNEQASAITENALFVMANDGSLSVFGVDSRFGILYEEFGLTLVDESIESDTHGQKISYEYIVDKDPDYLFVMDRSAVTGGDISASQVMENDLMKKTKAYQNDNIIYVDSHVWYVSSGGLTGTMKMVEEVQSSLSK